MALLESKFFPGSRAINGADISYSAWGTNHKVRLESTGDKTYLLGVVDAETDKPVGIPFINPSIFEIKDLGENGCLVSGHQLHPDEKAKRSYGGDQLKIVATALNGVQLLSI